MSNETEQQKALCRVKEGALRIVRHRELMAELRAEGRSTVVAERVLAEFQKIQAERLADLGKFGKATGPNNRSREMTTGDQFEATQHLLVTKQP